jgi:hypothetical protein
MSSNSEARKRLEAGAVDLTPPPSLTATQALYVIGANLEQSLELIKGILASLEAPKA